MVHRMECVPNVRLGLGVAQGPRMHARAIPLLLLWVNSAMLHVYVRRDTRKPTGRAPHVPLANTKLRLDLRYARNAGAVHTHRRLLRSRNRLVWTALLTHGPSHKALQSTIVSAIKVTQVPVGVPAKSVELGVGRAIQEAPVAPHVGLTLTRLIPVR